jgi:hypothetical protein
MRYSVIRQVDMSVNLPHDILSAFLRNSVSVELPQFRTPPAGSDSVSIEELIEWCNINCTDIFYASKYNPHSAKFGFYQPIDRAKFILLLDEAVANSSTTAAQ